MRNLLTATAGLMLALVACEFPRPARLSCSRIDDCGAGQVCDLDLGKCVTAVADASTGCTLDDECGSRVCQPGGQCAMEQSVLYVDPAGLAAGECTPQAPCELSYAKAQTTAARSTIRLANGRYELAAGFVANTMSLTIVGGRGAVIVRTAAGPALEATDGATLTVRGVSLTKGVACTNFAKLNVARASFGSAGSEPYPWLNLSMCTSATLTDSELTGSATDGVRAAGTTLTVVGTTISGSAGNGIMSSGSGLSIARSAISNSGDLGVRASTQTLEIHRSTISSNRGGGVSGIGGRFDITNNFIVFNGNDVSGEFGGLRLDTNVPGNRVLHNTIAHNDSNPLASPLYAGGLFCKGTGSFVNNLIVNNFSGSATQPNAQAAGTCDLGGSLLSSEDVTSHFVSPGAVPFNFHLADQGSRAVNAGVSAPAPETEDFDGDPRIDGAPDVGADELKR